MEEDLGNETPPAMEQPSKETGHTLEDAREWYGCMAEAEIEQFVRGE
jgi:hypothetical protein